MAIRHAVLPKAAWLADQEVEIHYPISGIPDALHMDNAKDFHSHALERGCQQHGIIELTHGVTGRIFRLMEAAAVQAIRNGREMIDGSSFDDENLLLPLVSMQVAAGRRRAARSRAA